MPTESPCLRVSLSPCLFYLGGVAAALAIGWAAAKCHVAGWSPVGLVSLGVGILLGLVVSKLAAVTGVVCLKRLVVGTATFALIAVLAEHTWLYQDFRRQWVVARASNPQVAMFRPERPWSPVEYLRHVASPRRVTLYE